MNNNNIENLLLILHHVASVACRPLVAHPATPRAIHGNISSPSPVLAPRCHCCLLTICFFGGNWNSRTARLDSLAASVKLENKKQGNLKMSPRSNLMQYLRFLLSAVRGPKSISRTGKQLVFGCIVTYKSLKHKQLLTGRNIWVHRHRELGLLYVFRRQNYVKQCPI